MDGLEKMENLNDRCNIVLLKLKQKQTQRDKKRLHALIDAYPDNEVFERSITRMLIERGMICTTNSEAFQNDDGNFMYKHPDLPKLLYTTEIGIKALKSNLFPSEFRQKTVDKRFRNLQAIGIAIAAIGGLITIVTLFYKLFQC